MIEKIVTLVRERGLKQGGVERQLALSENRISKWLGGKGEPTARQALRIARLFGVSVESLVDDDLELCPASGGLSREERALLDAARFVEGGPGEALRRLVNYVPAGYGAMPPAGATDLGGSKRQPDRLDAGRRPKR